MLSVMGMALVSAGCTGNRGSRETEAAGGKNNISAIQKYLKAEDYEHAFAMLPDITQEYLKGFL